jgi:hypothetical protein
VLEHLLEHPDGASRTELLCDLAGTSRDRGRIARAVNVLEAVGRIVMIHIPVSKFQFRVGFKLTTNGWLRAAKESQDVEQDVDLARVRASASG